MVREAKRVSIGPAKDLVDVVDQVSRDHEPRILQREGRDVAAVIDVRDLDRILEHKPAPRDIRAALGVVGSWHDIDGEALKKGIYQSRRRGTRTATRP